MKIYIVNGATGCYSDKVQWVACAYKFKGHAEKLIKQLNDILIENGFFDPSAAADDSDSISIGNVPYSGRHEIEEVMRKHDPEFRIDYTGAYYFLTETELRSSL